MDAVIAGGQRVLPHFAVRCILLVLLGVTVGCADVRVARDYVNRSEYRYDDWVQNAPRKFSIRVQICGQDVQSTTNAEPGDVVEMGSDGIARWRPVGRTNTGQMVFGLDDEFLPPAYLLAVSTGKKSVIHVFRPPQFLPNRPEAGWTEWTSASFVTDDRDAWYNILYGAQAKSIVPDPGTWRVRWRIGDHYPTVPESDPHITDLPKC